MVQSIFHETTDFERGIDMKLTVISLLILTVAAFAADRVVLFEEFTSTG
jgi:hypothetical protein